jgi:signal transduction histidine kinase
MEHSEGSLRFLKDTHDARMFGWGCFLPLYAFVFWQMQAHWSGFVSLLLMSLVYPQVMTLLMLRASRPLQLLTYSLIFEGVTVGVFAELACLDPILITVTFSIAVFNAGAARGLKVSMMTLFAGIVSASLVSGRLRGVETQELTTLTQLLLGGFLIIYILLVTHKIHSSLLHFIRVRNELARQKDRIEVLHQHLIDRIASPYISADSILSLIGGNLEKSVREEYAERIITRQRFENMGRRVAVLSHDLNNLLQPIIMSGEMLQEGVEDEDHAEVVEDLLLASYRARNLLLQHLRSPKAPSKFMGDCDVSKITVEAASLLMTNARSSAVKVTLDSSLTTKDRVQMSEDSLHRVLMNLGTNALFALGTEGNLRLSIQPANHDDDLGPVQPPLDINNAVVLQVSDDGTGMTPEVLEHIYEPYFTTRGESGGTGLGLATSFALVADAGGMMRVKSKPGQGTTFRIVLPVLKQENNAHSNPTALSDRG